MHGAMLTNLSTHVTIWEHTLYVNIVEYDTPSTAWSEGEGGIQLIFVSNKTFSGSLSLRA